MVRTAEPCHFGDQLWQNSFPQVALPPRGSVPVWTALDFLSSAECDLPLSSSLRLCEATDLIAVHYGNFAGASVGSQHWLLTPQGCGSSS